MRISSVSLSGVNFFCYHMFTRATLCVVVAYCIYKLSAFSTDSLSIYGALSQGNVKGHCLFSLLNMMLESGATSTPI